MAGYITPDVQEAIKSAVSGGRIRLALVPEEGEIATILDRADRYDASIDRELPSGVLLVEVSASAAEEFLSTAAIESASLPDRMEVMS